MPFGFRQKTARARSWRALVTMLMGPPLLAAPPLMAGEVAHFTSLDFGTIDLNPGGDTIVIAAQHGPASPTGSRSVVVGGSSGLMQLTSTEAEHVEIVYPESVLLSCGGRSLNITNIGPNSQYSLSGVELPGGGVTRSVSIGGSLALQGNETSGSCSGSMSIQLNFF